jgi:hypothetical protein
MVCKRFFRSVLETEMLVAKDEEETGGGGKVVGIDE